MAANQPARPRPLGAARRAGGRLASARRRRIELALSSILCVLSVLPRPVLAADAGANAAANPGNGGGGGGGGVGGGAEPLYLSPVVDGVVKPGVVVVLSVPQGILISVASLKAIGIVPNGGLPGPQGKRLFQRSGPVHATVDMASQVIRFHVPQVDLLSAVTSLAASQTQAPTQHGLGAFLNYAFDVTPPTTDGTVHTKLQVSGELTGVLFSAVGFLVSGTLVQVPRLAGSAEPEVVRLNTTYEYDQPNVPLAFRAGDIATDPPGWGRAEYLGGLQFATDYELQPSRTTFPTPVIGQTLAEPSVVSLLVNNTAAYQQNADAGPFSLVGIPVVSGLNEITVQTRSASGSVVSQTVPFYVSGTMLAPGLTAYNVSFGFIRHHYGQTDNLYSTPAFDATYEAGVSRAFTITLHAEAAPNLGLAGAGFETTGVWGDLNAALAVSGHRRFEDFAEQFGRLYSVQFSRSTAGFGISAGIVSATSGFDDLGMETGSPYPELSWHASVSATLPFGLGNVALADTVQSVARHNRDAFLLASYSAQITRRLSLTISCFEGVVRSFGKSTPDDGCEAGLSLALGRYGSAGAQASFGNTQTPEWGETYQEYPDSAEGPGGSIGNEMGDYLSRNIRLQDVDRYADMSADVTQTAQSRSAQLSVSGSVIAMDGLYFSRPTDSAFAVVDFGYPKLPVSLANQPVGVTDSNGRLLVPNLVPDYANTISVDPAVLPLSVSFEDDTLTVTPPNEGGVYAKFPIRKLDAVLLKIRLGHGGAPPAGSLLYMQGNETPVVIGYDGYVYISNPPARLQGSVIMSTGHCSIDTPIIVSVRNATVGTVVSCAN